MAMPAARKPGIFRMAQESVSHSVLSKSLQPHGLQPTRLLCPWNSLGRNCGAGCHSLLWGIFPTRGWNLGLPYCRQVLYHLATREALHGHMPSYELGGSMTLKERRAVGGQWTTDNLYSVSSKQSLLYFPEPVIICYHLSCLSASFGTRSPL